MKIFLLLCIFVTVYGRIKIVIRGETFRAHSHQGSREVGVHGYEPQKAAVRSHMKYLIVPLLVDMGYDGVEVHLHTAPSQWDTEFQSWYGPFLKKEPDPFEQLGDYDAVLHIRADMILKPLFGCALANADRNKVLFTFKCWLVYDRIANNLDRISDISTWIPRKLFNQTRDVRAIVANHDAMYHARSWYDQRDIGYLLPGDQHDSDPEKDWNPLYLFADRPEGLDQSSVTNNWTHICNPDGSPPTSV